MALGGLALLTSAVLWLRCGLAGCPNVDVLGSYRPDGAPELLDRNGEPFARLTPVDHLLVPLDSIPDHVVEAFVAVEDRRFREHEGVDWRRVAGALLANLRAGATREGSSTITMQLARNVFPDRLPARERTLRRKLVEVRVAQEIERRFTKDEILELYLNHIWFGRGARGIAAAAWVYFAEPVSRLGLAQGALLAALPRAPTRYDPLRSPEAARERRDLVLDLMEAQGRVGPEEAASARSAGLGLRERPLPLFGSRPLAPYLVDAVRRTLEERLGERLYTRPLRVRTTLDRETQAVLEDELERQLRLVESGSHGRFRHPRYRPDEAPGPEGTPYLQGAAVVLDPMSGEVLALVGGRDWEHSAFDRATRARRPLGSAFKPFVLAAALEEGRTPLTLLEDAPLSLTTRDGKTYEPTNFAGDFRGTVTLRETVVHSINVPVVRLADDVGLDEVLGVARRAGLGESAEPRLSLALGALEATPLEVARAYTPFAAGGMRSEPRLVLSIEDEGGRPLGRSAETRAEAISPEIAFLVTDVLQDAVREGTGRAALSRGWDGPLAGKTGTTDEGRDAWFVGYTPDLLGVVWIGLDRPASIVEGASGGGLAAPVWGRVLARLYRGRPAPEPWAAPAGVVELPVDTATGRVLGEACAGLDAPTEWFVEDEEPEAVCPGGEPPGFLARLVGGAAGLLGKGGRAIGGIVRGGPR